MRTITRTFEVKKGNKWEETFRTEDKNRIYKDFSQELMNCKVFKQPYYKRMTQYSNYDGTRTVVFYLDTGKSTYCIEA